MTSNQLYPTAHINATPSDFADTVLMPGDPLRSKYIAETFLSEAKLVNNVRGIQGYTGFYQGKRVSVMASGMGMPSMGIYSYELYNIFGVKNIIRIGSAGAMNAKIHIRDLVIAMAASTNSNYAHQYHLPGTFAPSCSYPLLHACLEAADSMNLHCHVGNVLSSDTFYNDDEKLDESMSSTFAWSKMGIMAVEMETAALYMNAARYGKNALTICTISDHLITGEKTSAEERQNSFVEMIKLALNTAISLD